MKKQCSENGGTVRIIVRAHTAFLPPATRDLVIPLLEQKVHRFRTGGPLGYQRQVQTVQHYQFEKDGWLVVGAGLVPRIHEILCDHGLRVTIDDRTKWSHFNRADKHLRSDAKLDNADIEFLNVLRHHPRGQIVVQGATQIAWYVALLGRYFPDCHIYVVVKNRLSAQQLVRQIKKFSDRPVTGDTQTVWQMKYRMLVAVVQFFNHCILDAWHIILFADPESASTEQSVKQMAQWQDNARYGFHSSGTTFTDYQRLQIEEAIGPVVFSAVPEESQQTSVEVMFVDTQLPVRRVKKMKRLSRKRSLFWHCHARNDIIAQLAHACSEGRVDALVNNGGAPRLRLDSICSRLQNPSVSILVESTEHGRQLLKRLPGWELLTDNTLTSCIPAVDHQQIATFAYVDRWGIGTNILIRGDGGSGWPLVGGFPRQAQHQDDSVLVVDFNDTVDGASVRDTRSRHSMYEQLEWDVVAVDSGQVDVGAQGDDPRPADGNKALDQPRLVAAQRGLIPAGQNVRT